MRRADRLFQIIQQLRRRRHPVTGDQLAEALGVSTRTIYRDIRDLSLSGVPITGEAGVGYVLSRSYDLPPLMFDEIELEALALGARMVQSWADPDLARAADSVLAKVDAVVPEPLRERIERATMFAWNYRQSHASKELLGEVRKAVDKRQRIRFDYVDRSGDETRRTVRPLGLFFWGSTWTLAGWCELREDFRSFRIDRFESFEALESTFDPEEGRTLEDLFRSYEEG